MRFRTFLCMATLFLACFTVAAWSEPLAVRSGGPRSASENQSVSGKISSIGDAEFSVEITKGNEAKHSVQFLVDDKTRVEGKLVVGAQAQVEYRSDSGSNIAVHVVVTPPSGARH